MSKNKSSKPSKLNAALILVVIVIGCVFAYKLYQSQSALPLTEDLALERVKGNLSAPVKIIEFIDFQCPACAHGSEILQGFLKDYPQYVSVELKYFPLQGHRYGQLSALYAECSARQGKFWPMHDKLIDLQDQWSKLNDAKPAFDLYANEIGLQKDKLDKCLQSSDAADYISKTKNEGMALGIRSTPSYVINGELFVGTKSLMFELKNIVQSQSGISN